MRKQHSYEDRLKYMKMLEEGYGQYYIHRHFGVSQDLLGSLWIKYQKDVRRSSRPGPMTLPSPHPQYRPNLRTIPTILAVHPQKRPDLWMKGSDNPGPEARNLHCTDKSRTS